jgi:hypothetical protein
MSGFTPSNVQAFLETREHLLIGASTAVRDVVAKRRADLMTDSEKEEASFLIAACNGDRDELVAAASRLIGAIEMVDRAKRLADQLLADASASAGDAA